MKAILLAGVAGLMWWAWWRYNVRHTESVMIWPAEVCEQFSVEAEESEWRECE